MCIDNDLTIYIVQQYKVDQFSLIHLNYDVVQSNSFKIIIQIQFSYTFKLQYKFI